MEAIKKLVKLQYLAFALLWGVALVIVLCFELGILADGCWAGNFSMAYFAESVGILLAVSLIPLSLKLFSLALVKKIQNYHLEKALKSYRHWSELRLSMLALVVWINLAVYYFTLNNIGALCALMGLTASLFCLPSEKRVRIELNISEE